MRGRATSVVLPALVVLGLVAVVAIAATGSTPGGDGETRPPSEAVLDAMFTLGLVAVTFGGILLVYGLMQRKAIAREIASGRFRRQSLAAFLLSYVMFVVLFLSLGALTHRRILDWVPGQQEEQEIAPTNRIPTLPPEAETSYQPSISWLPIAVVVGLVLAAAVAYVVSERRAQRGRRRLDEGLAEELAVVLDETLDDLRAERDPRRAIIAAYARLERVLAANGVPRRAAETSGEYLPRVLYELELEPGAIERLTALFTRAKFSQHDVDTAMKEEAIGALEQVRDELRLTRERSGAAQPSAAPAVGASS